MATKTHADFTRIDTLATDEPSEPSLEMRFAWKEFQADDARRDPIKLDNGDTLYIKQLRTVPFYEIRFDQCATPDSLKGMWTEYSQALENALEHIKKNGIYPLPHPMVLKQHLKR